MTGGLSMMTELAPRLATTARSPGHRAHILGLTGSSWTSTESSKNDGGSTEINNELKKFYPHIIIIDDNIYYW